MSNRVSGYVQNLRRGLREKRSRNTLLAKYSPVVVAVLLLGVLGVFYYLFGTFQDELMIDNNGFFLSDESNPVVLKAESSERALGVVDVEVGDIVYKTPLKRYYSSEALEGISLTYPFFTDNGLSVVSYSDNFNLINNYFQRVVGYEGLVLSYGRAYDGFGFTQIDDEKYLFMAYQNGVFINLYDVTVKTPVGEYDIPVNSFLYFTKNTIEVYARDGREFVRDRIYGVEDTSKVKFYYEGANEEYEYEYGALLEGIGTIYRREVVIPEEVEVVDHSDDNNVRVVEIQREAKEKVYIKPTVEWGDLSASVYSITSAITIKDPASVIVKAPTYILSIKDTGRVALRRSYYSTGKVSITGLLASTTYDVIMQYTYLDSDFETRRMVTVKLGEITTLGMENLSPVSLSYKLNNVYSKRIVISDLHVTSDLDAEALKGLYKVTATIDNSAYALSAEALNKLIRGESVEIDTKNSLQSNKNYDFEIKFQDRALNEMVLIGNTGSWRTSREIPTVTMRVTEREVDYLTVNVALKNPDNVPMANYKYVVKDETGRIISQGAAGGDLTLSGLSSSQIYVMKVYADIDLNDGVGTRAGYELGSFDFTTLSMTNLGFVNLKLAERSVEYQTAQFGMTLDKSRTNSILVKLINEIKVSLRDEDDYLVQTVTISGDDLRSLQNGEIYELNFTGLTSNMSYKISATSTAAQGETSNESSCLLDMEEFSTPKKSATVLITNSFTTENLIDFDATVVDEDKSIISDLLRVELRDDEEKLMETLKLDKNVTNRITFDNLSKNKTYNIVFYVDEYNETEDLSTYEFHRILRRISIYTDDGISGAIEVVSSRRMATGKNLVDMNSNAKWIESANSGTIHRTTDSNGDVHIYSKGGASSYTYDVTEYTGQMVKATFKIKAVRATSSGVYFTNYLSGSSSGYYSNKLTGISTNRWTTFTFIYALGSRIDSDVFFAPITTEEGGKNVAAALGFYIAGGTSEYIISDYQIQPINAEELDMSNVVINTTLTGTACPTEDQRVRDYCAMAEVQGTGAQYRIATHEDAWYRFDFDDSDEYKIWIQVYNDDGNLYRYYTWRTTGYTLKVPAYKRIEMYFVRSDGVLVPIADDINLKVTKYTDIGEEESAFEAFSYDLVTKVKVNLTDARNEITKDDYYITVYDENGREVLSDRYVELTEVNTIEAIKEIDVAEKHEYTVELGIRIYSDEENYRYYALDSFALSTMDEVVGISTPNDFRWMQPYGSYAILNDIDFKGETFYLGYGNNPFNATVDFQGYTMSVYTESASQLRKFYRLGENALLKNLVLDVHINNKNGLYLVGFVEYNYGTVEDFYVNIYDERETVADDYYMSAMNYFNYPTGVFRRFVVELHGDLELKDSTGLISTSNRGTIESGYVFGGNLITASNTVAYVERYGYATSRVNDIYIVGNIIYPDGSTAKGGMVAAYNYGVIENTYTVGDTNYNAADAGPIVGALQNAGVMRNAYYMADYNYTMDSQERIYALSLNDADFQKSILSSNFNVDDLIEIGYFPHIIFRNNKMPKQEFIELPEADRDSLDIVSIEVVESEQENDSAIVKMVINNPYGERIDEIGISNLHTEVLTEEPWRQLFTEGNSYVYVKVSQPTVYKSKYSINSITSSYSGRYSTTKYYAEGEKYLRLDMYKEIWNVHDWRAINNNYDQNYAVMTDLDFNGYSNLVIGNFTGKLKGNGHTISNVRITTDDYGLFNYMYGSISDLRFENVVKTGAAVTYNALIGVTNRSASLNDVHVKSMTVNVPDTMAEDLYIAGLVASSNSTRFKDCSVTDIRINSNAEVPNIYAGGLIGLMYSGVIYNSYVQDIDMVIKNSVYSNGIGGLVGRQDSVGDNVIANSYTTGVVESNNSFTGGLIGSSWGYVLNSYSAVDVISQLDSVGGIVGYAYDGSFADESRMNGVTSNLFVGSVYSYYTGGLVSRILPATETVDGSNFASADSLVNGKKTNNSDGETLLTYAQLKDASTYTDVMFFGEAYDYSEASEGILPKLYYENTTTLLPNQKDNYLHEEVLAVNGATIQQHASNADVTIVIDNPEGWTITGVDIEFVTIDRFNAVNVTADGTTIINVTVTPQKYLDSYRLAKIYYTDTDGEQGNVMKTYKLEMRFYKYLYSYEDWQNQMGTDVAENYMLRGDLVFPDEFTGLVVDAAINRLETDGTNYKISNIDLAYTENRAYRGLIKKVVTNMENVTFEDITFTDETGTNAYSGVVTMNYGNIKNCTFRNINITAPSKKYVAVIARNTGKTISGIVLEDITITGSSGVAGLVAEQVNSTTRFYNSVRLTNGTITGSSSYVGGVFGDMGGVVFYDSSTKWVKGMEVYDSTIRGGNYTGGIAGRGDCNDCKVDNTTVYGNAYVGGISGVGVNYYSVNNRLNQITVNGSRAVGGAHGDVVYANNDHIIDSEIIGRATSTTDVGGVVGESPWSASSNEVLNTSVTNAGSRTGGISGTLSSTTSISNCLVQDSEIKGVADVGGVTGRMQTGYLSRNIVARTYVKGTTNVGGLIGYINNNGVSSGYFQYSSVEDTTIWADDAYAGGFYGRKYQELDTPASTYSNYFEGSVAATDTSHTGILAGDGSDDEMFRKRAVAFYQDSLINGRTVASLISTTTQPAQYVTNYRSGYMNPANGNVVTNYYYRNAGYSDYVALSAGYTYDFSAIYNKPGLYYVIFYYDANKNYLGAYNNETSALASYSNGGPNGYVDRYFNSAVVPTGTLHVLRDCYIKIMIYDLDDVSSVKIVPRANNYNDLDRRQMLNREELQLLVTWKDGSYSGGGAGNYDVSRLQFSSSYFDFSPLNTEVSNLAVTNLAGNGYYDGVANVSGATSDGFYFDGKDDVITINDVANFAGQTQFTISARVRQTNTNNGYIFYYGNGTGNAVRGGFGLRMDGTQPYVKVGGGIDYLTNGANASTGMQVYVPVGTSAMVTVTYDGTTIRAYIDGILARTVDARETITTPTTARLYVGYAPGTNSFSGVISDVQVYNRVLSATEVQTNYASSGVSNVNGLLIYYDLTTYKNENEGYYPQLKTFSGEDYNVALPEANRGLNTMSLMSMNTLGTRMLTAPLQTSMDGKYHVYASGLNTVNIEFDEMSDDLHFSYKNGEYESGEIDVEKRVYTIYYDFENDLELTVETLGETLEKTYAATELARVIAMKGEHYYYISDGAVYDDDTMIVGDALNLCGNAVLLKSGKMYDLSNGREQTMVVVPGVKGTEIPLYTTVSEDGEVVKTYYNFSIVEKDGESVLREGQILIKDDVTYVFNNDGKNNNLVVNKYNTNNYQFALNSNGTLQSYQTEINTDYYFNNANIEQVTFDMESNEPVMMIRYDNGYTLILDYYNGAVIRANGEVSRVSLTNFVRSVVTGGAVQSVNTTSLQSNEQLVNALTTENSDTTETAALEESGISISAANNYTVVYNNLTQGYEVYSTDTLLDPLAKETVLESMNNKIMSDSFLYNYFYEQKKTDDSIDKYRVVVYGIIIAAVIVNLGLLIRRVRKNEEQKA